MTEWYVSTTGASGNAGTIGSPWDFDSARTGHSGSIQPGDGVWLRGGTYASTDTKKQFTLSGTALADIVFRAYNPSALNIRDINADPTQMERVIFQHTQTSAAPTSGATTAAATAGGASSLNVAKAAGVNQAVIIGQQINVASGPAAGIYIINANTTIVQNTTTAVPVLPNVRSTGTAGGETITLTLTPSNVDFCEVTGSFITFWNIEFSGICSLRSINIGGAMLSTFLITNDGLKVVNCIFHDDIGAGVFLEKSSGEVELYGNLVYNHGGAKGDGGGHGMYLHHDDPTKFLNVEANCFFNDHGWSLQFFDSSGSPINRFKLKNNIAFNSGQLNTLTAAGGPDSTSFAVGGSTAGLVSEADVIGNHCFQIDGRGDRGLDFGTNQPLGPNVRCMNNYLHVSGTGFATMYASAVAATTGSFQHTGNTYRTYRSQTAPQFNGHCVQIGEAGSTAKPGQYTWGGNKYYRNVTATGACGDETGGNGQPFAFNRPGASCANRRLTGTGTTFSEACGFPTSGQAADTVGPDPSVTESYVIKADKYETGRGWIVYYNYGNLTNIPVDLSSVLAVNDIYVIHDVRNIWAGMSGQGGSPVIGPSTYAGGTITVPNTQLSDPAVVGGQPGIGFEVNPPATAPRFNAFLVRKVGHAPTPPQGAGSRKRNPGSYQSFSSSGSSGL